MGMRPLQGIKVLDLTRVLSGPYCTMTLADLGAEVIKIEPPQGDDTRYWGPPFAQGESTYYLSTNRSKQSVVLNLKSLPGVRAFWDLLATADIVVENFRPGTLAGLGIGWQAIHEQHPMIILVSISGYGQSGPLSGQPGYDLIAQGEGGLMGVTGEPERPPVKVGFSVADIGAGMWATIGTLAALRAREQTGQGDHVDVSLLDTVVSWQTYHAEAFLVAGEVPRALGSAHPTIAPYQSFAASDGYFNLAVGNDRLWERLCDVLDDLVNGERWYRRPEFAHNQDRVQVREALAASLSAIFAAEPRSMWLARFARAGIPAGSVNTVSEVFDHPQVRARDMIQQVTHPTIGPMRTVKLPIVFANSEIAPPVAPPLLGADSAHVLRSLGYTDAQVAAVVNGDAG
jgi:crotonobetainyl-CoA:carnitine CoA-transferase CaiB-like acyl-CoA transferase